MQTVRILRKKTLFNRLIEKYPLLDRLYIQLIILSVDLEDLASSTAVLVAVLVFALVLVLSPIYYVFYINHNKSENSVNILEESKERLPDEIERKLLDAKIKTLPVNMIRWVYEINADNIEDNDQQLLQHITERFKEKYYHFLTNRHALIKDLGVSYRLDNLTTRPISIEELSLADGKKIYLQPGRFDVLVEAQISAFRDKDNTKVYSRPIAFWLYLVTSASKDNGGLLVDDLEEIQWKVKGLG